MIGPVMSFDSLALIEWRRLDGLVLRDTVLAPGMATEVIIPPTLYGVVDVDYDVYAREKDGEWAKFYEVRREPNGSLAVALCDMGGRLRPAPEGPVRPDVHP